MTDPADHAIDALLRNHLGGPVDDAGFSEGVMARLPAKRAPTSWPTVLGLLVGVMSCAASLSSTPLAHIGWRDWLSGEPSLPALVVLASMAGMAVLALAWAIAETDESHLPQRSHQLG